MLTISCKRECTYANFHGVWTYSCYDKDGNPLASLLLNLEQREKRIRGDHFGVMLRGNRIDERYKQLSIFGDVEGNEATLLIYSGRALIPGTAIIKKISSDTIFFYFTNYPSRGDAHIVDSVTLTKYSSDVTLPL